MIKSAAIIVAAGLGKRFGEPKQFVHLSGKPIYLWSIETFESLKEISKIILVLPPSYLKKISSLHKSNKKILCVAGGKERFQSVANGLKKLPEGVNLVAIHDAARPLISPKTIKLCLKAANKYGAAVPVVPPYDTVKITDEEGEFISRTLPRQSVRLVQTPQVFKKEIILKAYAPYLNSSSEFTSYEDSLATDDSYFIEKMGIRVKVVQGEVNNFKITTPNDLARSEYIISDRKMKK